MATARRRKAEERGVRRLREMTALPHNRACGDCGQRGPTYADMTVGSFVCTACSGLLRGLNPPHRVKSISMTTFSQQEIDFLQSHGNEVCRATWMGLHSERVGSLPDHKDSQKTKEFLQDKYEKKRWFIPPEQAFAATEGAAGWTSAESGGGAPPSIAQGNTVTQPAVSIRPPRPGGANVAAVVAPAAASAVTSAAAATSAVDLLGDLGVGVDAGPAVNPRLGAAARGGQQAEFTAFSSAAGGASSGFADFDAFGSSDFGGFVKPSQSFPGPAQCSTAAGPSPFSPFEGFPKSSTIDFSTVGVHHGGPPSSSTQQGAQGAPPAPSTQQQGAPGGANADRYAALADLDNLFGAGPASQGAEGSRASQAALAGDPFASGSKASHGFTSAAPPFASGAAPGHAFNSGATGSQGFTSGAAGSQALFTSGATGSQAFPSGVDVQSFPAATRVNPFQTNVTGLPVQAQQQQQHQQQQQQHHHQQQRHDKERVAAAQYLTSRCLLLTYFRGDIASEVDEHFSRALSQKPPTATQTTQTTTPGAEQAERSERRAWKDRLLSPMTQRNFPPSFWSSSTYHHGTGTTAGMALGAHPADLAFSLEPYPGMHHHPHHHHHHHHHHQVLI